MKIDYKKDRQILRQYHSTKRKRKLAKRKTANSEAVPFKEKEKIDKENSKVKILQLGFFASPTSTARLRFFTI